MSRHQAKSGPSNQPYSKPGARFEDGLCSLSGSYVPFACRKADRVAGDPRRSIEERYGSHDGYVAAEREAGHLIKQGFLLPEDADRLIAHARNGGILK